MGRRYVFHGHSDDLVEISGHHEEEIPLPKGDAAVFTLQRPDGLGLKAVIQYAPATLGGVWCVGVAPLEEAEDKGEPSWPVTWSVHIQAHDPAYDTALYSTSLEIIVPDDDPAVLTWDQNESWAPG